MTIRWQFRSGSTATEAANRVRRPETSQEGARQSLESAIKDSPAGEPITITTELNGTSVMTGWSVGAAGLTIPNEP